jgi:hypothetical protein
VAAYCDLSLSDFIRRAVVEAAREVLDRQGPDKVLEYIRESSSRLAEERFQLFKQAIDSAKRVQQSDSAPSTS